MKTIKIFKHLFSVIRCDPESESFFSNDLTDGNCRCLTHISLNDLKSRYRLPDKAINLLKALPSLSRLIEEEKIEACKDLSSPSLQANYVKALLFDREEECVFAVYLDSHHKLKGKTLISRGSEQEAALYPTKILKGAIESDAKYIVLAHNHPSGILQPSESDLRSTSIIRNALNDIGVELKEHYIVTDRAVSGIIRGTRF